MLRLLIGNAIYLSDALIHTLGLEKKQENKNYTIYQKGGWIYAHLEAPLDMTIMRDIADTYIPERIYFVYVGYAIDVVREIGDVIVPNVFFPYREILEKSDITEENRDKNIRDARFLTHLEEQKDYYVEDYGLSVGGIIVDGAPHAPSDDLMTKMMLTYEADAYTESILAPSIDIVGGDEFSALIIVGVIAGKKNIKYPLENPIDLTVKNILTTIKLLEDQEK